VWKARGEDVAGFRPPAGESFTDVLQRVTPCIGRICSESSGPVLVVTHAGVIRVLICKALGMPISGLFRIRVDYGGLTLIDYHENEGTLIFCNMLPRIARVEFESFSR
jgi:probable phosphoglycerate mutase